jgi:alkylation response protein AidB-like acyl-CoA dehydrogenase
MRRTIFDETHELFRSSFRSFVEREVAPHVEEWERNRRIDKELFLRAGKAGFLGISAPAEYGGSDQHDFRYNAIMAEEFCRAGVGSTASAILLHNDTCLPYLLGQANEEQRRRWLPGACSGEIPLAVAMTEPGAGSDLAAISTRAERHGSYYLLNGTKTFITNGLNADLVIVACKTDPTQRHRGMSLLAVESGMPGFSRGRQLDKIGHHAQDTAELVFTEVRVPVENLIGEEGTGFRQLVQNLPSERLSLAVYAVAHAQAAFDWTLRYCKERKAFGQPIGSFQNSKFKFAEMKTELDIAQVYIDKQIEEANAGTLTAEDAAEGKWWCTEMNWRVLDTCLQLHGGYGYIEEYPIARAWRDGRIPRIYGGTTEIMKEIVGRSLGL